VTFYVFFALLHTFSRTLIKIVLSERDLLFIILLYPLSGLNLPRVVSGVAMCDWLAVQCRNLIASWREMNNWTCYGVKCARWLSVLTALTAAGHTGGIRHHQQQLMLLQRLASRTILGDLTVTTMSHARRRRKTWCHWFTEAEATWQERQD